MLARAWPRGGKPGNAVATGLERSRLERFFRDVKSIYQPDAAGLDVCRFQRAPDRYPL